MGVMGNENAGEWAVGEGIGEMVQGREDYARRGE